MQSNLYAMRRELANILKQNKVLRSAIREVNKTDMVRGSLIARNPRHEKVNVDAILSGQLQRDVPVGDYVFIQNFTQAIQDAFGNLSMGNTLDKWFLINAYRRLVQDPDAYFRKSNPVVYALNHVPPHSFDVDKAIDDMFRKLNDKSAGNDVVLKAMYIHNKIYEIYPFEEYNGELAIFAMNYYLLENGFTPVAMPADRGDYLELVAACLKGHRQEDLYNYFFKIIYDKMEGTLTACREHLKEA